MSLHKQDRIHSNIAYVVALACALTLGSCDFGGSSNTLETPGVSDSGRTFGGDFMVRSNKDLGKLSAYDVVEGDIYIEPWEELIGVELPKLKVVEGSILISSVYDKDVFVVHAKQLLKVGLNVQVAGTTSRVDLEFPKLDYIGGHLDVADCQVSINAPRLTTINGDVRCREITWKGQGLALNALETVNGSIRLIDYTADYEDADDWATDLRFPDLKQITGNFQVRNGSVTTLDAPNLFRIGGDVEVSNVSMDFALPKLTELRGHLRFRQAGIRAFDLKALETIHGLIEFHNCQLEGGTEMDFSGLHGIPNTGGMTISGMGNLQTVRFGCNFVEAVSNITISGNANLGTIDFGCMTHIGAKLDISYNGPLEIHATELLEIGNLHIVANAHTKAYFNGLEHLYGSLVLRDTMLHALVMEKLEETGGDVKLAGLTFTGQDYLLTGLRWVRGGLEFSYNKGMPVVTLPALEQIGAFWQGTSVGDLQMDGNDFTVLGVPALASVARHLIARWNSQISPQSLNLSLQAVQVGGTKTICENGEFSEPPCAQ